MEEESLPPLPPSLRLQILKGPRQGETLEFRPGSTIRIGRVVRGNKLTIKDPGISTHHLSISPESSNWILRDLASSNGTILDDLQIPPNTPLHLHDGSTIKIGETTSILLSFLQPQQNHTRTTRTGSVTFIQSVHQTEEDAAVSVPKPVRARRSKALKSINENNASVSDAHLKRVTRNLKRKQNVVEVCDSSIGNSDAIEEKLEKVKNTRVTLNKKNKQEEVIEISDLNVGVSDALKEKVEEEPKNKNTRVTRSSKNKVSVIEENLNLEHGVDNAEKMKTRGGAKGKKRLHEDCVGVDDGGKENSDETERGNLNRNENVEKKKTRGGAKGKKKLQEECIGDGGKENRDDETERGNLNGDMNCPDLEKMTLGEWFDFLEVHFPKQIIDVTEEMFDSMRKKAERLCEYITMQGNSKLEVPLE